MNKVYLSLGTNIGEREKNIKEAVGAVALLPGTTVCRLSELHETDPVGYTEQPMFLNMCLEIETELSPHALLGACLGIERIEKEGSKKD